MKSLRIESVSSASRPGTGLLSEFMQAKVALNGPASKSSGEQPETAGRQK
jgi:hypothetical protein